MRPALRYALSLFVGVIVAVSVVEFAATDRLLAVALLPLYASVTSMTIAHRQTLRSLSRDGPAGRKRNAVIGGIGGITVSMLLHTSVPIGLAGIGLLVLGMVGTVADFSDR